MTVIIIIPAFNSAAYLEQAVQSVMAQSFSDWKLLIIDDHSTDRTFQIAEKLASSDSRIQVLQNSRQCGTAYSRNRGIKASESEYIAFLDSDDLWRKDKLERQLTALRNNGFDFCYTEAICIDEPGTHILTIFHVPQKVSFSDLLGGNDIICSSVLLKRKWAERYLFNEGMIHEDFVCWAKMLYAGCRATGLQEPLVYYRRRKGSRSFNKLRSAKLMLNSYHQLHVPVFQRIVSFVNYTLHGIRRYLFIFLGKPQPLDFPMFKDKY